MMQNGAMVKRLVLRPGADVPGVRIEAPSEGAVESLHLGSQDLIRLAGFARSHGFNVARFLIADGSLTPLDRDEEQEMSDELVAILSEYDADELDAALTEDYDGFYIIGVELVSLATGLRLNVRRSGYISTSAEEEHEAERLISDAWRELRLA
jgi:hypothetical protein